MDQCVRGTCGSASTVQCIFFASSEKKSGTAASGGSLNCCNELNVY